VKPTSPGPTRPVTSVGFDFFRAAPLDARGFVRHARIREGAVDAARPGQLVRFEGVNFADFLRRQPLFSDRSLNIPIVA
jgi:hypothetical protein